MKLFFCCGNVTPGTLFTIAILVQVIDSIITLSANIPKLMNHGHQSSGTEDSFASSLIDTIIGFLLLILATYAFVIYLQHKTITAHPQLVYYTLNNIILLVQIIVILIVGILALPLLPFLLLFYSPIFLLYSWNSQLKKYAEGENNKIGANENLA